MKSYRKPRVCESDYIRRYLNVEDTIFLFLIKVFITSLLSICALMVLSEIKKFLCMGLLICASCTILIEGIKIKKNIGLLMDIESLNFIISDYSQEDDIVEVCFSNNERYLVNINGGSMYV